MKLSKLIEILSKCGDAPVGICYYNGDEEVIREVIGVRMDLNTDGGVDRVVVEAG